jgi:protein associated with RNAse G/E
MPNLWKPGEVIAWRGIYRNRIWHAMPTMVVNDSPQELVLAIGPGAECMVEENYARGKKNGKRRWDFKHGNWTLQSFAWHTNRLLFLLEPGKYYSTILFWNNDSGDFLCYYVNFQLPFERRDCGIDTLDLDLDLIVDPDLGYEWKDLDDYEKAIDSGVMLSEWTEGIENSKYEILRRLVNRQYPFDGSWLDWMPDPTWSPPTLPGNWDKI